MKTLFLTQMLRFGDLESHHYIVGLYDNKHTATFAGEVEKSWRGGKYEYQVLELEINPKFDDELVKYHTQCHIPI